MADWQLYKSTELAVNDCANNDIQVFSFTRAGLIIGIEGIRFIIDTGSCVLTAGDTITFMNNQMPPGEPSVYTISKASSLGGNLYKITATS